MWQCPARTTGGAQEAAPGISMFPPPSAQREVVSYQELSQSQNSPKNSHSQDRNGCQLKNGPPGIKNGGHLLVQKSQNFLPGQQNKQISSLMSKGPFLKRKANQHQHPNKIARLVLFYLGIWRDFTLIFFKNMFLILPQKFLPFGSLVLISVWVHYNLL